MGVAIVDARDRLFLAKTLPAPDHHAIVGPATRLSRDDGLVAQTATSGAGASNSVLWGDQEFAVRQPDGDDR